VCWRSTSRLLGREPDALRMRRLPRRGRKPVQPEVPRERARTDDAAAAGRPRDGGPLHGGLLDIGSGVGVLSFELLERGVTSAVGVDLSSAHVAIAAQEASRRGRSESPRFLQGDSLDIATQLPSADVVTLDRVVCCYPEYERFLEESLRNAGRVFAFSYPLDRWYVRTWVGLENCERAVTRNAFRSFVHPVSAMEDVIRREGFRLLDRRSTRTWRADVYGRS
jgi:SAM-dependent methyltransferase